ncbi:XRE family transcriptional regulator [Chakrabartia godavariana]|nr:XRE family transcriptional regulator [Chakrabartia godavariana]
MTIIADTELDLFSYPFANTAATKMLADAFDALWKTRGVSQRQLAARLGYRGSVCLSHMATGRISIPVGRVLDLAHVLEIDPAELLLAVLEQRHPEIPFRKLLEPSRPDSTRPTEHTIRAVTDV